MADIKKIKGELKDAGDIANSIVGIITALAVLKPVVDTVVDTVNKKVEERKGLIVVPELYSKGIPIKLERAIIILKELGFKVEPVAVKDANVLYKDCFDLQIVRSKPKQKYKAKLGERIFINYVTSEIIEDSRKLFDELEKQKVEVKNEKTRKRLEQKERIKKSG